MAAGLPTGGWGYAFLPYVARFVRSQGLPALSHTGRFHESWGDNAALKPRAALLYECGRILGHGLTSGVGDVLHPRGAPSPAVYELVGSVYGHIAACEPFLESGRVVSEVAVIVDPGLGANPGASNIGAVRALQQLRVQFDVVPPEMNLGGYRAVVVPEATEVDDALAGRLDAYRGAGGAILLVGPSLVGSGGGPSLPDLPVEGLARAPSGEAFLACQGVPGEREDFPVIAHGSRLTARPRPGAEILARVVEPYHSRAWDRFCGHSYTPPARPTDEVAVAVGDGVAAVTVPLFEAFHEHGVETYRRLLGAALDRLVPDPLHRGAPDQLRPGPGDPTPRPGARPVPPWSTCPCPYAWRPRSAPCGSSPPGRSFPGATTATTACGRHQPGRTRAARDRARLTGKPGEAPRRVARGLVSVPVQAGGGHPCAARGSGRSRPGPSECGRRACAAVARDHGNRAARMRTWARNSRGNPSAGWAR
ncbi:beta-galactosidase trimerization domain-containing protein [Streptomyces coeruleoprunus]|uniref:Beta-galactosidase trimerization domain-containing protein n=1 Tax=Streptomyces coeruleoprunus TaxID=285563 RepID=A0ABV9XBR0_9ACTN